jgi:predicted ATPase
MPRVIVTGGPGSGKTTLLAELGARGYATVDDSARAVIAERLTRGLSRRPDSVAFAEEVLRRDIEKYGNQCPGSQWVFFDRGLIDAVGMLHEASRQSRTQLESLLASYPFYTTVFVLPPWQAIYVNDEERDQTFGEAVAVHARIEQWYRSIGYLLNEVPRVPVEQRAEHVLQVLASGPGQGS